MDYYLGSTTKPIDEGMYPDETGGNFDYDDDDMGGSGEAMMRIDSSTVGGFMSHHHHLSSMIMTAEKIVHGDFFNDFGDLFDTDNFVINDTTTTTTPSTTTTTTTTTTA